MQCEKCGKEYTGEEAVCPECKVPIDGAAKREDAVVAKEADGNPETAGVAGESAGSVEEGTSESDGSEADDGENGTGEEDQEEAGILDESQVEEPAPPRKYGKFIVLGVVLAAVILLAVFSKPVFYGIGYNVAKQMENKSEGIALTFGKVAFKFNQTEDVKQLLERVYLAKAERQVYTDIDAAIRTANAGLAYYKFEDLNVFMESAKELKADVQAYGGNYVAAVGNDRISIPEFKVFLNQAKNQAEQAQGLLDDKTKEQYWSTVVDGKTVADKLKEDTLNKTLEFKIEYMKAKEAGTVADKQTLSSMYSEVENYVQSQGGGQAGNEKFKAETGVGSSQFKAFYREFMIINKYAEEYKKNAKFSDEELQKHYTKNEAKLKKVTVRHILLLTQDMNTGAPLSKDKQQKAKEKADSLLKRIKAGEDIKTLATEFSEDPGVKENFGEYTFAKTGQMVPEFEDWAFKAKVGDVAIVKSQFGYHVMKLEKFGSMADVKEDVRMSLASEKLEGLVDVWKKDKQFAMTKNTKVFDAIKLN